MSNILLIYLDVETPLTTYISVVILVYLLLKIIVIDFNTNIQAEQIYPILSYPILSYPILSYPILSYPIYATLT